MTQLRNGGSAADAPEHPRPGRVVAATFAVMAAVTAVVFVATLDDEAERDELELVLPDPAETTSCLPFDGATLAQMEVAFLGTVTDVSSTTVTLAVDRWYRSDGRAADVVTMRHSFAEDAAALDGVEFVTGEHYLVTADAGVVGGCGYTGVATPELEAEFEEVFAS
jgi:hypothetical protein